MFKKIWENEKLKPFLQFIKFGLVGVSNTLLSYLLYIGFLRQIGRAHV